MTFFLNLSILINIKHLQPIALVSSICSEGVVNFPFLKTASDDGTYCEVDHRFLSCIFKILYPSLAQGLIIKKHEIVHWPRESLVSVLCNSNVFYHV